MDAIKLAETIRAYTTLGLLVAAALRRDGHGTEADDIEAITTRTEATAARVIAREQKRREPAPPGD